MKNNFYLSGDLAFLLDTYKSEVNKPYIEKLRGTKHNPKIGLNLSELITHYFNFKSDNDIINIGVDICKRIYSTFHNSVIVYVPHVFVPERQRDDRLIGKRIFDKLPEKFKKRFICIDEEMTRKELKAIIFELDMLIASRMHACIGSISVGTPLLNLAYSDKSIGLIRDYLGTPYACIDVRNMESEKALIDTILERSKIILLEKEKIKKIYLDGAFKFKK